MAHPKHTHVPGGIYFVSSVAQAGHTLFADDQHREPLGELLWSGFVTEISPRVTGISLERQHFVGATRFR